MVDDRLDEGGNRFGYFHTFVGEAGATSRPSGMRAVMARALTLILRR